MNNLKKELNSIYNSIKMNKMLRNKFNKNAKFTHQKQQSFVEKN